MDKVLYERCVYQMHFRGFKVEVNIVVLHVYEFMSVDMYYAHGMMYACACRGQKLTPCLVDHSQLHLPFFEPFFESRAHQSHKSS